MGNNAVTIDDFMVSSQNRTDLGVSSWWSSNDLFPRQILERYRGGCRGSEWQVDEAQEAETLFLLLSSEHASPSLPTSPLPTTNQRLTLCNFTPLHTAAETAQRSKIDAAGAGDGRDKA